MDDAIGREEVELEVVPETEASAADRVQVIVGRRQDLGAWHGGDDSLQAPQDVPRVPRRGERRNAVYPPLTGPAADMGERKPLKQPSRDFLFQETKFPHLRSQPASSTFRLVLHCKHHYHQVRSDVAPPIPRSIVCRIALG